MRYSRFAPSGRLGSFTPAVLVALALSAVVCAQTPAAPQPQTPARTDEEEAIALTPFVVNSTSDNGYLASNTLAGSRMNTELRNVANTVSVFTPEFMADLGATAIEDLMEYGLNTQVDLGAGDFNHQGDQNSVADGVGTQKNFRVRGQESSVSLEYFGQAGPLDTYNLERAELSSGPNAILFGTGAAGGLLNMSVKRPNFRRTSLENRVVVGSFGERRFTTDLNIPVIKDVFGLRMQALHGKEDGWQQPAFKNTDRGTFSALVRPLKTTRSPSRSSTARSTRRRPASRARRSIRSARGSSSATPTAAAVRSPRAPRCSPYRPTRRSRGSASPRSTATTTPSSPTTASPPISARSSSHAASSTTPRVPRCRLSSCPATSTTGVRLRAKPRASAISP